MNHNKVNILEVLAMMGAVAFFAFMTTSLVGKDSFGTLFFSVITLFFGWIVVKDLRRGMRSPTRWEWFKAWMTVRPLIVGAVGFAVLTAFLVVGHETSPSEATKVLITGGVLAWALLILYTILRAPRRESDSSYKERMGYKE